VTKETGFKELEDTGVDAGIGSEVEDAVEEPDDIADAGAGAELRLAEVVVVLVVVVVVVVVVERFFFFFGVFFVSFSSSSD